MSSLIVVSSIQVVQLLGVSSVLPTSSLHPAMAYERQSVGGRLGNHNVAPYLLTDVHERCTGPSAIDFVVPTHPSWASNYLLHSGTLPPESLSAASADFAFLAVSPRAVATRPRLRKTFDSCVMFLLRALQHSATPPGQGFRGVPLAIFSALSSSIAAFNILSN